MCKIFSLWFPHASLEFRCHDRHPVSIFPSPLSTLWQLMCSEKVSWHCADAYMTTIAPNIDKLDTDSCKMTVWTVNCVQFWTKPLNAAYNGKGQRKGGNGLRKLIYEHWIVTVCGWGEVENLTQEAFLRLFRLQFNLRHNDPHTEWAETLKGLFCTALNLFASTLRPTVHVLYLRKRTQSLTRHTTAVMPNPLSFFKDLGLRIPL